ncbi:metalloregulator ArsR/SmtB family transcription factor [uncultured Nocardioides sp.]|uniref:ArsR/SmtB family transcription factor n=1 Tax=uncultured Nocardioides sp. TaxID=198441 RepID=UPI002605D5F3|nr:metalloregulator ArsR/SmtB family transcription factor [uncultured Nocardioides sp.]
MAKQTVSIRARAPLAEPEAAEFAVLLKAVADPVRLRLVSLVAAHDGGEACVCDLTGAFDLSAPTISHHLKVLREAGVLDSERRGTWVHYRVRDDVLDRLAGMLGDLHRPAGPRLVSAGARR